MSLYSKFCAWLSGWPESNEYVRNNHEQDYLFAEEEKKIRENNKNIGKKKGLNAKKARQKSRTARGSTKG